MFYPFFKRLFDLVSALLLLLLISPFFGLLAILVRINLGSPVFFKQARAGKDMKTFELLLSLLDNIEDVSNVYHNVEM